MIIPHGMLLAYGMV